MEPRGAAKKGEFTKVYFLISYYKYPIDIEKNISNELM